jgi:hypothetical protein
MDTQTPVKLYPDTGHHFFFLPFGEDPRFPIDKVPKALVTLAQSNQDPWKPYEQPPLTERQTERDTFHWCQWRYGVKESISADGIVNPDEPGIWVCVETNLGDCRRGSLMRDADQCDHREYRESDYPSRYYAVRATDEKLQFQRTEILLFAHEVKSREAALGGSAPSAVSSLSATSGQSTLQSAGAPPPQKKRDLPEVAKGWIPLQEFRFWWPEPVATNVTEVDLIVDFGNSRSAAVLLERPKLTKGGAKKELRDLFHALRMMPRGRDYEPFRRLDAEDPYAIFDSWFVTRESLFSHLYPPHLTESQAMCEPVLEPVKTRKGTKSLVTKLIRRVPQMFVEMAPVALGREATEQLAGAQLDLGRTIFLSSPKRYLWDSHPIRPQSWGMMINPKKGVSLRMNARLAGYVLQYMPDQPMPQHAPRNQAPEGVSDWELHDAPTKWKPADRPGACPDQAKHSRSDTMVWVALAVLEQAYRQISTSSYLGGALQFVRRRLKSVVVTYPPGWTGRELEVYRRKWNTALNIFAHGHLADLDHRPKLIMNYDEALGAQLPIIYSEIVKLGGSGGGWIQLVGRPDAEGDSRARVMSIDIGGGTTDYAIFEYKDLLHQADKTALECQMLFNDSSQTAGDILVKRLIEEMLLPKLGQRFRSDPRKRKLFEALFRVSHGDDTESWSRITRLVFIPKINQWLSRWGKGLEPQSSSFEDNIPVLDPEALEQLNCYAHDAGLTDTLWEMDFLLPYSHSEMETIARHLFRPLFEILSRIVTAFGVDMIILSGKPSEIPALRALITEVIPLLPSRIIPVKDYQVGTWYPYQTTGRIYDAKTVTASGVALLRAIDASNDLVPGWLPIAIKPSYLIQRFNCWTAVPKNNVNVPIYLHNGCAGEFQEESELIRTTVGSRIGRTILPSPLSIEPVYVIAWRDEADDERFAEALVSIKVKRIMPEDPNMPEYLELTHVEGSARYDGRDWPITLDMLELQLRTLTDSSFWIDSATFSVLWPKVWRQ